MADLWRDTRYAIRVLGRTPGFTTTAVLLLALGIGACAAIYTIVHAVLIVPLPYADPDRLVHVWQVNARGGHVSFSDPNYDDVRARSRSFQALAQYSGTRGVVVVGSTAARARIAVVSREFPDIVRIQPALGRWFVAEEQQPGGRPAAVVSHGFWQQYLAGNPVLEETPLAYDGRAYVVVGVLPPNARFPNLPSDIWVPRELFPVLPSRTAHNWRVLGRLGDGVSPEAARADVRAIAAALKQEHGDATWMADAAVVPLHEDIVGRSRTGLLVLLGGAVFLLLVACGNVVNLLLARAVARQREVAVRAALGAGRGALLGSFALEAILLGMGGAALGLLVATLAVNGWLALEPRGLPRMDEIRIGAAVVAFTIAAAIGSALMMGLVAGWRALRQAPAGGLSEGTRTTGGRALARLRGGLTVMQIATSLVLLVGAGLVVRSVTQLLQQDPGFRTEQVVALELTTAREDDPSAHRRRAALYQEVIARLGALPGVASAGGVNAFPMVGAAGNGRFLILSPASERWLNELLARCGPRAFAASAACLGEASDGFGRFSGDAAMIGDAEFRIASGDYFAAMGIPLIRGRLFDDRDGSEAPHVAVISESLARARWPDRDPIGARIQFGNMDGDLTPFTVVGVVGDIRERGLDSQPQPMFYGEYRQRPAVTASFTIAVHGTVDPAWLMRQARDIVREVNPQVPVELRTIEQVVAATLVDRRVVLMLLGSFAAAALLIAAIGIYGVIAYSVAQRRTELGVRMAVGATGGDIWRLVFGEGARLTLLGIAVGLVVALVATRALSSLLFGVVQTDPATYAAVSVLLAAVAAAAAHIPARRATRVDPVVALRRE